METNMRLQNKVALVTGAPRGLGRAMAAEGADLVIADIQQEALPAVAKEIEAWGRQCLPVLCDVSSSQQVARMFTQAWPP